MKELTPDLPEIKRSTRKRIKISMGSVVKGLTKRTFDDGPIVPQIYHPTSAHLFIDGIHPFTNASLMDMFNKKKGKTSNQFYLS
jgi:hypothetical protein